MNAKYVGMNGYGGRHYTIGGAVDFSAVRPPEGDRFEAGDTLMDRDGQGKTLSAAACSSCGRIMWREMMVVAAPIWCSDAVCQKNKDDLRVLTSALDGMTTDALRSLVIYIEMMITDRSVERLETVLRETP